MPQTLPRAAAAGPLQCAKARNEASTALCGQAAAEINVGLLGVTIALRAAVTTRLALFVHR